MRLNIHIRPVWLLHQPLLFSTRKIDAWVFFLFLLWSIFTVAVADETKTQRAEEPTTKTVRAILDDLERKNRFLDVDEAFQLSLSATNDGILSGQFLIAAGYYLYRDKITFTQIDGTVKLRSYSLPPGRVIHDAYFGDVEIYDKTLLVSLPLSIDNLQTFKPATIALVASYQGCAKRGICYPPVQKTLFMSLPTNEFHESSLDAAPVANLPITLGRLIGYLAAAFSAGILLSFTPCVLPLIPILSSVIAGQGRQINHRRTGALSIVYVLGTATTYTAIGAIAGSTGEQLQAYFQNMWAIGTVSLILTLMALSLFGLFTLQMPNFLQTRLVDRGHAITSGTMGMIFGLGVLSALVVGACVSPILISIVTIAILNGNPIFGGALMFSVATGMGVILISVGFGASYILPKVGRWMESVQKVFGLMLLAVSIYLLSAIQAVPILLLWSMLLIGSGIYFGSKSFSSQSHHKRLLSGGFMVILVTWGLLAAIGHLNGERNILQPVSLDSLKKSGLFYLTDKQASGLHFVSVTTLNELDQYLSDARSKNQPVLLDYYADWCTDCIRMEKTTFLDSRVISALKNFVLLQVDVTNPKSITRVIKQRYNVFGPPAMVFFDNTGLENNTKRIFGYKSANELILLLNRL